MVTQMAGKAACAEHAAVYNAGRQAALGNSLRAMVKRHGKKAGIAKEVHPHRLRHTFATDLYRETKNIRLVQKVLGHRSLSTTVISTHIVDEELGDALRKFRRAWS